MITRVENKLAEWTKLPVVNQEDMQVGGSGEAARMYASGDCCMQQVEWTGLHVCMAYVACCHGIDATPVSNQCIVPAAQPCCWPVHHATSTA